MKMNELLNLCIQELVETVSTPHLPFRCMHRGLLALLRIGTFHGVSRPGLIGVIGLALRFEYVLHSSCS